MTLARTGYIRVRIETVDPAGCSAAREAMDQCLASLNEDGSFDKEARMARSPRRELEKDNPSAPQIYQSFRKKVKPAGVVAGKRNTKKASGKKVNG